MNTNIIGLTFATPPNYLLAVMWKDDENNTFRYALWNNVGEVIDFALPLYAGQLIKKNFRLEAWSVNGEPVAVNPDAITFFTSLLTGLDYRYGQDTDLEVADTIVTQFGAGNVIGGVFPILASQQAHWVASTGVTQDTTEWIDTVSAFKFINVQGGDIVISNDSSLATQQVVDVSLPPYQTNNLPALTVNPSHYFVLCKILKGGGRMLQFATQFVAPTATINVVDSNNVTVSLEDGNISGLIPLNRWGILEVCYNASMSRVVWYDLYNSPSPTAYPTGFSASTSTVVSGGGTLTLGTTGTQPAYNVAEIAVFNQYIGLGSTQLLLNYFSAQYNFNFNLPLVFPANSTPLPN